MSDHDDTDDDKDRSGYRRPPKRTQFQKGQSGNPKGRPKDAKNFATGFRDELNERLAVTENGRRRKISKRRGIIKQVVNKALGGDLKAIPIVLNEARIIEADPENGGGGGGILPPLTPADDAVMETTLQRLLQIAEARRAAEDIAKANPPGEITNDDDEEPEDDAA